MRSKVNVQQVYADTFKAYAMIPGSKSNRLNNGAKYSDSDLQLIGRSNLILTAPITSGMTQANFNINVTNGNPAQQSWELRLQITDSFTCYRLGVFAYGIIGTSTGPAGNTSYKYWSYAPYQLAKTFVTIAPLWDSGALTMILNSVQYTKSWATNEFKEITRTQDGPFQPLTTSGAANNAVQGNMDGDTGMIDVEPYVRFNGNWSNQIAINWQNAQAFFIPVTNYVYETDNADDVYISISYVNIVMGGLLGQNLTTVLG